MSKFVLFCFLAVSTAQAEETIKVPFPVCPEGAQLGDPQYASDATSLEVFKGHSSFSKLDEAAFEIARKADGTAKKWLLNHAFSGIWATSNPGLIYRVETEKWQGWVIRECEPTKK